MVELPHVARPGVTADRLERAGVETRELTAVVAAMAAQEEIGEARHVLPPLAQRRQVDLDGVEPVEQVLAETTFGDLAVEVGVGGGHDAHVHPSSVRRTQAFELAGFEHPQELRLLRRQDVGDFVEEEGAAVRGFEAAHAVPLGIGEGAPHVAEELAFEDPFGECPGVDRDERPGSPARGGVERPRHHPFAGAVFTRQEHVRVRRADPRDELEHRPHGRRFGDQDQRVRAAEQAVLFFERLAPLERPPQLHLVLEHRQQAVVVPGFFDEVPGSPPHRLDRHLDAAPGGHHHHRQVRLEAAQAVEQLEAFAARGGVAGVVEVHQQDVEVLLLHGVDHLAEGGGAGGFESLALEQHAQGFAHVELVVRDQGTGGGEAAVRIRRSTHRAG